MAEFDDAVLPYQEEGQTPFPPKVAKEQAVYTGEMSDQDTMPTTSMVDFDLANKGMSTEYDAALDTWKQHQEQVNRDAVIDVISDPNVDKDSKLSVVAKFQNNELESTNLRDAYVLKTASNNDTPIEGDVLAEDFDAQQAWIDSIRENVGWADQTQAIENHFAKNLSGSTEGVLGSLIFDTLAPTDLHSLNSALIAEELGVQVEIGDLHPALQLTTGPILRLGMFDFARNFMFNGTLSKKMNEAYNSASPEQKKKMMEIMVEQAGDSFGTDFNKFTAIQSALDPVENTAGVAALDFLGIVGLIPFLGALTAPLKTAKHYTELKADRLSRAIGIHPKLTSVKDLPPTKVLESETGEFVGPQQPTGAGEVNATNSVVVRNEDGTTDTVEIGVAEAKRLAEQARVKATRRKVEGKIYVQSEQAKARNNAVARIETTKLERILEKDPGYVAPGNVEIPEQLKGKTKKEQAEFLQQFPDEGLRQVADEFHITTGEKNRTELANDIVEFIEKNSKLKGTKGYKNFSRAFDDAKEVKAPEVVVDKDGGIRFEEGSLRYAVMRDKGIKNIGLSMNAESAANAHKHGLISDFALRETIFDIPELTRFMRTTVPPASPAGIIAATNPVTAGNRYASAIVDQTGEEAAHLGTNKGQILADSLFTKLDTDLETVYPNIFQKLKKIDEQMHGAIKRSETNPIVHNITSREKEVDVMLQKLKGIQGGVYNPANSTMHLGRIQAEGVATYGRTADYGWNTQADALVALENIKKHSPDFPAEVVQMGQAKQWFVQQQWNKRFNQADRWMFGAHSMDSSILGINTSGLSRTAVGDKFVFPKTMRGDPDFAKAGLITEYRTSDIESRFFGIIKDEIMATPHWRELNDEFDMVQETGVWVAPHQLASRHPHLDEAQVENLANSYYSLKRGNDYLYDMVNIIDRNEILSQDLKAIVHSEKDVPVAYGKEVTQGSLGADVKKVWDLDTDSVYSLPNKHADGSRDLGGRQLVKLRKPMGDGSTQAFEYAVIGMKTRIDAVPTRTLPKIEGWMPRRNTEAWYISATPKSLSINGTAVNDVETLSKHIRTVGAGSTKKEADMLMEQLKAEFGDHNLSVREAQENLGDDSLSDYQLYSEIARSTRKRGDRLPTLNGQSRLEEPVQAFVDSVKVTARQFAEADHRETFQADFVKAFDRFLPAKPGQGKTFPNDVQELTLPPIASAEERKQFKVAQRLLIQHKDQRYTATDSDKAVTDVLNALATKFESLKWGGKEVADVTRAAARQGNVPLRLAKTITSHLYLYLSSAQWLVQTQQLIELSAISPGLIVKTFTQVPAISAAILARSPHLGYDDSIRGAINSGASKFTLTEQKEFEELVDIIYNSGLPQSVDLNQMLHGVWQSSKFTLDPSAARQAMDATTNLVSLPGKIGKNTGYGPAELAANIGTWLFAKDRWIDKNPGKDWKGQSAVAQITADAWDINHSMSGRSGSMDFQKGVLGLALQFFAVQIKGFMQLLSSKTLTTAEKYKLGVARMAIYGLQGVPLGGAASLLMDKWVDDTKDPEIIDQYQHLRNGMLDATTNTALDIINADPKTLDDFIETGLASAQGKGKHDIQLAKRLSPVPEGIPQLEVMNELYKVATGESPNGVRFPFVNAFGSLGKAVQGTMDMWRATDLDTPEKVVSSLEILASASSLGNNYNKAMAMQIARDKNSATGANYGIGEVTLGKVAAQFLGVTTREEENVWKVNDIIKEKEAGINERSDDIMRVLQKLNLLEPGSFEYNQTLHVMNVLNAYTHEGDREAVRKLVDSKVLRALEEGTMQEHYATRLWNWHADGTDKKVNEALDILRRNSSRNPKMAEMLELINNTGYFEDR